MGVVTSTTPGGKIEGEVKPFQYYISLGVSFIASAFSSKPREMAQMIRDGMDYPGFSIVHVQSPCTTYNDNYEVLRGNAKKGIVPLTYDIPEDHDPTDLAAALQLSQEPGIPLGVVYAAEGSEPLDARYSSLNSRLRQRDFDQLLQSFAIQ